MQIQNDLDFVSKHKQACLLARSKQSPGGVHGEHGTALTGFISSPVPSHLHCAICSSSKFGPHRLPLFVLVANSQLLPTWMGTLSPLASPRQHSLKIPSCYDLVILLITHPQLARALWLITRVMTGISFAFYGTNCPK